MAQEIKLIDLFFACRKYARRNLFLSPGQRGRLRGSLAIAAFVTIQGNNVRC